MASCLKYQELINLHKWQVGGVLKLSEPADSKTDPGLENCPTFEGVIGQNKI